MGVAVCRGAVARPNKNGVRPRRSTRGRRCPVDGYALLIGSASPFCCQNPAPLPDMPLVSAMCVPAILKEFLANTLVAMDFAALPQCSTVRSRHQAGASRIVLVVRHLQPRVNAYWQSNHARTRSPPAASPTSRCAAIALRTRRGWKEHSRLELR